MIDVKLALVSETQMAMSIAGIGDVRITAPEVERLIVALSQVRSKMKPEVPRKLPDGQLPPGPIDPIWAVQDFALLPGKVLLIRQDGYGWSTFQFPPTEAAKLGAALLAQSPAAPSAPQGPTNRPN